MKKYLFLFLIVVCFLQTSGQIINGKIFDAQTKVAIPFASVYYDQTFVGASADQYGNFTLNVSKNGTMPLVVSAVGYYSVSLPDYLDKENLEIYLNPKVFEINEITIQTKSLKRKKERYLRIFEKEFIGTTKNAKECVILNEEDITFNYNSKSDTIKAYALKPILIENRALGYTITYYLDKFEYSKRSNYIYFSGRFIFSENMTENEELIWSYKINRETAYYGSRAHFVRTLYSNKLEGTGYEISDSSYNTLNISDIVFIDDNQQKFIKSVGKINIDYHRISSAIYLTGNPIIFNEAGYFDPNGIIWSGYMGNQRMADWLPYEYIPRNNKH